MPDAPPQSQSTDPDVKLAWEIRKLQAETAALHHPFRNPSVIAALTTTTVVAFLGVLGFALQWARSDREYTLAQIKTQKLELDLALLERRRSDLNADLARRNVDLLRIARQIDQASVALQERTIDRVQAEKAGASLSAAAIQLKAATAPLLLASVEMSVSPGSIRKGESALLNWSSTNADRVTISPKLGLVSPHGSIDVSPSETTTYTMVGTNASGGFATGSVTLHVEGPIEKAAGN